MSLADKWGKVENRKKSQHKKQKPKNNCPTQIVWRSVTRVAPVRSTWYDRSGLRIGFGSDWYARSVRSVAAAMKPGSGHAGVAV